MNRYVIVDPFRGTHAEMSRQQVERYLQGLARIGSSRRYATLAFNHFTCGRLDQTNAALAKLGVVFYRRGGAVEARREAQGSPPRWLRTPQGLKPLNAEARKTWNPEPPTRIPSTIQPKPSKKPWWRR